ncbi:hypothetical protein B0H19DRAFT_1295499 [Mycena capillaripes]|nr:hypothetical protein B0H19DRAFT_1295499 [Mycena capillaripes]
MARTTTNKKAQRQKAPKKAPPRRGVFRAPSPSPTPSPDGPSVVGPSKSPPLRVEEVSFVKLRQPRKTANRPDERMQAVAATRTARKKDNKVKAVQSPPSLPPAPSPPPSPKISRVPETWVHVGNLDPEATAEDLTNHFARCGAIQYVNIRYSSSGVPGHPQTGYRYAIVKFDTLVAVDAAVDLSGGTMMGSDYPLVVKADLLDLPEVRNLPEFSAVAREAPSLVESLSPCQTVAVPLGNKLQTASGLAVNSAAAAAKTKVWKPDAETERKKRKARGKRVVVGAKVFVVIIKYSKIGTIVGRFLF